MLNRTSKNENSIKGSCEKSTLRIPAYPYQKSSNYDIKEKPSYKFRKYSNNRNSEYIKSKEIYVNNKFNIISSLHKENKNENKQSYDNFSDVYKHSDTCSKKERKQLKINYSNYVNAYYYPKSAAIKDDLNNISEEEILSFPKTTNFTETSKFENTSDRNNSTTLNTHETENNTKGLSSLPMTSNFEPENQISNEHNIFIGAFNSNLNKKNSDNNISQNYTSDNSENFFDLNISKSNQNLDNSSITNFTYKSMVCRPRNIQPYFSFNINETRTNTSYRNYMSSNTSSTCSSSKDELHSYAGSPFNNSQYFRKNSNSNFKSSSNLNSNSNNSPSNQIPFLNLVSNKEYDSITSSSTPSTISTCPNQLKKRYHNNNKFNSNTNLTSSNLNLTENSEVLTVKIKHHGSIKILTIGRFDDVFATVRNFTEKNKLGEDFVKPIVIKVSQALYNIYKVYNSNVEKYDQDYLNSLNILSQNQKTSEDNQLVEDNYFNHFSNKSIIEEEYCNLDITTLSSATLHSNSFDDDDQDIFFSVNKSF